ncbi:MAG: DNA helicase, partial [Thermodesulfobacteriota bacterium]
MSFVADLHIHSYYSRATSKRMNLENIFKWAQIKGVAVVATGDFTHPLWFAKIREKLEPAEEGLFSLRKELSESMLTEVPLVCRKEVRFILSAEVSSIYSKNGRVRKIHNLIYAPDFETVSKINARLDKIGNLKSDGRPILGLDAKELLKI